MKRTLTIVLTTALAAAALSSLRIGAQTSNTMPQGNAARGQVVYTQQQCWACHGYNGETGTRLLQEDGTFIVRLLTPSGFVSFLRAPRPNDAPPTGSSLAMPSYGVASLSNQHAADLFAYIKTFKPTQPPLADIPILSQMIREGGKLQK